MLSNSRPQDLLNPNPTLVNLLERSNPLNADPLALTSQSTSEPNAVPTDERLGRLRGRQTVNGRLTATQDLDIIQFQLDRTGEVQLQLAGLSSDVDLYLWKDVNNNSRLDDNEILSFSNNNGTLAETISLTNLASGDYYALVYSNGTTSNYNLTLTSDFAGSTLDSARNLGVLNSNPQILQDFVGNGDRGDLYRFQLTGGSNLEVRLSGLTADADIRVIQDQNRNGVIEAGEVIAISDFSGTTPDVIRFASLNIEEGYIQVIPHEGNTNYSLNVSANLVDSSNTLENASNLGILNGQRVTVGSLGRTSVNDFTDITRFRLTQTSDLQLDLTGLSRDADLFLIQDINENGRIDTNEILASSMRSFNSSEQIQVNNLAAGSYFVGVELFEPGTTEYTLTYTVDAAGETLATARSLGVLTGSISIRDFVGDSDLWDMYRLRLNNSSDLNLTLRGLSSDADLWLIRDTNRNGVIETEEILARSQLAGTQTDNLSIQGLAAGEYFVVVGRFSGNTNYILDLAVTAIAGLQLLEGTLGADTFQIGRGIAETIISGNGNVNFGSGQRDTLNLSSFFSNDVRWNLLGQAGGTGVAIDLGDGTRLFDALTLGNGQRILFEGIERILFADRTVNLAVTPNDPLFNDQWNLHMMGVQNAWRLSTGSERVAIGIQDTGLGVNAQGSIHPDLRTQNSLATNNYRDDFLREVPGQAAIQRTTSHGTAVQSIIAAESNNGIGIAGINWGSTILTTDVLDNNVGDLPLWEATRGMINQARSQGQRLVINMSLGGGSIDPRLENLIAQSQNDVLFVISAGNNNRANLGYPASLAQRFSNVIAVGAVWGQEDINGQARIPGTRINYTNGWGSNYGEGLTLMGPSEVLANQARLTNQGMTFGYETDFNGTSASAPNVAGVASLVWSANSNLTATQVQQVLAQTAYDLGVPGYDRTHGHGFVNADAAVRRAIAIGNGFA
jgi:serine protease